MWCSFSSPQDEPSSQPSSRAEIRYTRAGLLLLARAFEKRRGARGVLNTTRQTIVTAMIMCQSTLLRIVSSTVEYWVPWVPRTKQIVKGGSLSGTLTPRGTYVSHLGCLSFFCVLLGVCPTRTLTASLVNAVASCSSCTFQLLTISSTVMLLTHKHPRQHKT